MAYDILSDAEKRILYDLKGEVGIKGGKENNDKTEDDVSDLSDSSFEDDDEEANLTISDSEEESTVHSSTQNVHENLYFSFTNTTGGVYFPHSKFHHQDEDSDGAEIISVNESNSETEIELDVKSDKIEEDSSFNHLDIEKEDSENS